MAVFRIAVIGGDGIGPEVIDEAIRAAEVAARKQDHAELYVEPAAVEHRLLQDARPHVAREWLGTAPTPRRHPLWSGGRSLGSRQDHRPRTPLADAAQVRPVR